MFQEIKNRILLASTILRHGDGEYMKRLIAEFMSKVTAPPQGGNFLAIPSIHPNHGVVVNDDAIAELVRSCERLIELRAKRRATTREFSILAALIHQHTMTHEAYERALNGHDNNDSGPHGATIPTGVDIRAANQADNDS